MNWFPANFFKYLREDVFHDLLVIYGGVIIFTAMNRCKPFVCQLLGGGVDPRNTCTELLRTPTQTLFLHRRRLARAISFGGNGSVLREKIAMDECGYSPVLGEETEKLTQMWKIHLSRMQMSKQYSDDATKNLKVVYGSFFFKDRNAKI